MTSSTVLAALGVLTLVGRRYSPSPVRSRRRAASSRGAVAIRTAERKIADLQADIEPNRQLSTSFAFDAEPRATDAILKA
jgi:hypothetical protein